MNPATVSAATAANSSASGSVVKKNQFRGVLFRYGPKLCQVAFRTGDYKQQLIFIGGLTDGFMGTQYLEPLAAALDHEKWSLVQILLSSSYTGYGTSSLEQLCAFTFIHSNLEDAMELDQLISYLINTENFDGVVLLGHRSGCRDIVHYMHTNAACSRAVRAAILQAPVSDREYQATLPETASMIDLAPKMINEGKGTDLLPRYHSLYAYMGGDDMFSSDLSDYQLRMKLGHMSNTPCQIIYSMADEYVPEHVDKAALVKRKVEIEHGNHSLSNRVGGGR